MFKTKNLLVAVVSTLGVIGSTILKVSATSILVDPVGAGPATVPSTVGIRFSTSQSLMVTHLSFYDEGSDGLSESHTVGLWDSQQNLLFSVTFPSGTLTPLSSDGSWRLMDIPDFELPAGGPYVVAGTFSEQNGDPLFTDFDTTILGVSYRGGLRASGAGLTYPTAPIRRGYGSSGIFVVVPEPSVLIFFALGLFPLILERRRKLVDRG